MQILPPQSGPRPGKRPLLVAAALAVAGFVLLPDAKAQALVESDVAGVFIEDGYELDLVVGGLTYPSNITHGAGRTWVTESGFNPMIPPTVRELVGANATVILSPAMLPMGTLMGPFTDVTYHDTRIWLSHRQRGVNGWPVGAISSFSPSDPAGTFATAITNLPSVGDHSNNEIVVGPDGRMYFGQGSATNSAVVGADNVGRWTAEYPGFHEIAPVPLVLNGREFVARVPTPLDPDSNAVTAPYRPFDSGPIDSGYVVPAATPASPVDGLIAGTGTVYSFDPGAADPTTTLRLEAWGLRNPFGLTFDATDSTRLFVSNNGADIRGRATDPSDPLNPAKFQIVGNRPIANDYDEVFALRIGGEVEFFGWPEYFHDPATGLPVRASDTQFCDNPALDADDCPGPIFDDGFAASLTVQPVFAFAGPYVSVTGLAPSTDSAFAPFGTLFTTESGSFSPQTGAFTFTGYEVTRTDPSTGQVTPFIQNRGPTAAELFRADKLNKPVSVSFEGNVMYVVDLGVLEPGINLFGPQTGKVWVVRRAETDTCIVDGGGIALVDGSTATTIVVDNVPDPLTVLRDGTAAGPNRGFVITDSRGQILALPDHNGPFDLNGAGVGSCQIWYLAYDDGLVGLTMGANIADLTGCFDFSNPITVDRVAPGTGTVMTGRIATPAGDETVYLCPGPGNSAPVSVRLAYSPTIGQVDYAVTDETFTIIGLPPAMPIDLSGAGSGTCYIFAFNYTGTRMVQLGDNVFSTRFSDGEYLISNNAIRAVRKVPAGGTIATHAGETEVYTCVDGQPDYVGFRGSGMSGSNYVYVITDDANVILMINDRGFQDFDGAGVGACRVWGLSYTGAITARPGDNVATTNLSDGCFDLSDNFLSVVRQAVEGARVTSGGREAVTLRGADRNLVYATSSASTAPYGYFILDERARVVAVTLATTYDFGNLPDGKYFVYGVSHTGDVLLSPGDAFYGNRPAAGCFEQSTNALVVTVGDPGFGFTATPTSDDRLVLRVDAGEGGDRAPLQLTDPQPVRVILSDVNGRTLVQVRDLRADAIDGYRLSVPGARGGVYFVTVVSAVGPTTRRVVLP